MFFLLRMAFWFSLVLLALPLGSPENGARTVGAIEALAAAREAVGDLAGICERKPEVCETGRSAVEVIGVRAREGSRIAYELLDDRFGEPQGPDAALTTGTVAAPGEPGIILPEHAPLPR